MTTTSASQTLAGSTGSGIAASETNLNIDFRAVAGNPPLTEVSNAPDAMRLVANDPKTVIPYPELRTGEYSFYPVCT